MTNLTQAWPRPTNPRPIAIIGAGAIVRTAHLPVYRRLGYPVAGVYDVNCATARETAALFDVERVFHSLDEACGLDDVVYDLAVPGDQIVDILRRVPEGSGVLAPSAVPAVEGAVLCAVSSDGKLLVFPVNELPELPRGKGNKIFGISSKKLATREEFLAAIAVVSPTQNLIVRSGDRKMTLKFNELKDYRGERAQRGAVLPRGWRKVERLDVEG